MGPARWLQSGSAPPPPAGRTRFCQALLQQQQVEAALQQSRIAALNLMEDAVAARNQAEQAAAELRESEHRMRHRDGRELWVLTRGVLVVLCEAYRREFVPADSAQAEILAAPPGAPPPAG